MSQTDIWNKRYSHNNKPSSPHDIWITKHIKYLEQKRSNTFIDLGCGKGAISQHLYENGFNVIACDFSPVALEALNKANAAIATKCFDMTAELPIPKGDIGVVIASLSTHYFSAADTEKVYQNVFDILENFGYFIFRVNSMKEYLRNDKDEVSSHIEDAYYRLHDGTTKRYFTIATITELLKAFSIIELNEGSFIYHSEKKYYIEGIAQKH